jgi:hypothetical protein
MRDIAESYTALTHCTHTLHSHTALTHCTPTPADQVGKQALAAHAGGAAPAPAPDSMSDRLTYGGGGGGGGGGEDGPPAPLASSGAGVYIARS